MPSKIPNALFSFPVGLIRWADTPGPFPHRISFSFPILSPLTWHFPHSMPTNCFPGPRPRALSSVASLGHFPKTSMGLNSPTYPMRTYGPGRAKTLLCTSEVPGISDTMSVLDRVAAVPTWASWDPAAAGGSLSVSFRARLGGGGQDWRWADRQGIQGVRSIAAPQSPNQISTTPSPHAVPSSKAWSRLLGPLCQ